MNNHLTQNQMARWLLGGASPEENVHARNCARCRTELSGFRDAIGTFRTAMKDWSELESVPALERRTSGVFSWTPWFQPSLRWVLAGMAALAVVILPVYSSRELEREAHEDAALMDEVAAHLSRPLPMSMERVMMLLPSSADETVNPESEEVR
jgi:hypothetical protein